MSNQDFNEMQEQIEQLIQQCETAKINKAKDTKYKIKKLKQKINYYDGYVQEDNDKTKIQLYRKKVQQIQQLGMTAETKIKIQDVDVTMSNAKILIGGIKDDLRQANTQGQLIMKQLNEQMQDLDRIKNENKDVQIQLKRIKNNLADLFRGIMTDKCTCGLIILLILGIIALIVIHFVKKKNTTV